MQTLFNSLRQGKLQWLPELDIGYFPVTEQPYDKAYWGRYRALDRTPMGAKLTALRVALVSKYLTFNTRILDIGVGGGRFVNDSFRVDGYDINPEAVAWLRERGRYVNPYDTPVKQIPNLTFWDSLEHIHDFTPLLGKCTGYLFISLPIFRNVDHVLSSKHFRKDEHCWYFTNQGLIRFMDAAGFDMVERNRMETEAGREGIGTYVFKRKGFK